MKPKSQDLAVAVFYEGDTVLALAVIDFRATSGKERAVARVFEYLVRSGRDGHYRRTSISPVNVAGELLPRGVATDEAAVAWFRADLDACVVRACEASDVQAKATRKGAGVGASLAVREVHSGDWAEISKVASELGAETLDGELNEAGELKILGSKGGRS